MTGSGSLQHPSRNTCCFYSVAFTEYCPKIVSATPLITPHNIFTTPFPDLVLSYRKTIRMGKKWFLGCVELNTSQSHIPLNMNLKTCYSFAYLRMMIDVRITENYRTVAEQKVICSKVQALCELLVYSFIHLYCSSVFS